MDFQNAVGHVHDSCYRIVSWSHCSASKLSLAPQRHALCVKYRRNRLCVERRCNRRRLAASLLLLCVGRLADLEDLAVVAEDGAAAFALVEGFA
jgi:hypothetical protein